MGPKRLSTPPLHLCWHNEAKKGVWVELESWAPPKHEHVEGKRREWGF